MKVTKLIIKNIGKIKNTTIELNKPLILFYGEILAGKSTILNAVRWCFGGSYPSDLITHGAKDASVTLEVDNGLITREWYMGKDDKVKDRPIVFIKDGKPVKRPVEDIKRLLNPFLLDQDFLRKKSESERKLYFMDLFGVDTSDIDRKISELEAEAKNLRIQIKMFGAIEPQEATPVDIALLQKNLSGIKEKHDKEVENIIETNRKVAFHNANVQKAKEEIGELRAQLEVLQGKIAKSEQWLTENSKKEEHPLPKMPGTAGLESKITEASAINIKAEQYQKDIKRAKEKKEAEGKLAEIETSYRKFKKDKIIKLAEVSKKCGIDNLVFDEAGEFIYQNTSAGMLSTSQIMSLSKELSALYPEGLGIDLIDRAESLGKSIFEFVRKAEEEDKTILATIVGEKPAKVPENIGVFVVEEGELK